MQARLLAALLAVVAPAAFAAGMLGVLEEHVAGGDSSQGIRLAFAWDGHGWKPVCKPKAGPPWEEACGATTEHAWSILDQGRAIAELRTKGWESEKLYKDAGLLKIEGAKIPKVGAASKEFAGWPDEAVHRPLVAIEGSVASRPAGTIVRSTAAELLRVQKAFREARPRVEDCEPSQSRPIRPGDVEMLTTVESTHGPRLIGVRINRRAFRGCDVLPASASDAWFVDDGTRVVAAPFAIDNGDWPYSLRPIAIGDFNGDGHDEALFWFSGYNQDGYVLFFDDFKRSTTFTWSYH